MTTQSVEERLQKLELEVKRAQAVTECANLMNKYQWYHMKNMRTEETHLFALKSPGACVEMVWGVYDGPESVLRWKKMEGYGKPREPRPGFPLHIMTTPIIEVAKDGETAKGVWLMIGVESGTGEKPGEARVGVSQFAMDFIKEDGEWKIWKYGTFSIVRAGHLTNYGTDMTTPVHLRPETERPVEYQPDRLPTYKGWRWSPDKLFPNLPPVPLPYDTWDDSLACVPLPENK